MRDRLQRVHPNLVKDCCYPSLAFVPAYTIGAVATCIYVILGCVVRWSESEQHEYAAMCDVDLNIMFKIRSVLFVYCAPISSMLIMVRTFQDIPDEVVDTIDKDMGRTFPDIKRYASTEGQESMARILRAYAAYDPEVGYCQARSIPTLKSFTALLVITCLQLVILLKSHLF